MDARRQRFCPPLFFLLFLVLSIPRRMVRLSGTGPHDELPETFPKTSFLTGATASATVSAHFLTPVIASAIRVELAEGVHIRRLPSPHSHSAPWIGRPARPVPARPCRTPVPTCDAKLWTPMRSAVQALIGFPLVQFAEGQGRALRVRIALGHSARPSDRSAQRAGDMPQMLQAMLFSKLGTAALHSINPSRPARPPATSRFAGRLRKKGKGFQCRRLIFSPGQAGPSGRAAQRFSVSIAHGIYGKTGTDPAIEKPMNASRAHAVVSPLSHNFKVEQICCPFGELSSQMSPLCGFMHHNDKITAKVCEC